MAIFTHTNVVARSSNTKTGNIPVTYRDMDETCPRECPFFNNGCYGDGRIKGIARKHAKQVTQESALSTLSKRDKAARYLRDRVVGDILTDGKIDMDYVLGIAAVARQSSLIAFGYTHAWRRLTKRMIKSIAASGYVMNASCETVEDVQEALAALMPAVITNDDIDDGTVISGKRVITCPAQTRDDVTCASCGLCAKPDRKVVIRFLVHGASKNRARAAIAGRIQ